MVDLVPIYSFACSARASDPMVDHIEKIDQGKE